MAYNLDGWKRYASLGSIGNGSGSTKSIYAYHSNDTLAVIEGSGYFNSLINDLSVGDLVDVMADLDGTPQQRRYFVSSVTTNVALSRVNPLDLTDSSGGTAGATIAAGVGMATLAFFINLADIANGDLLTNYVPGYRFKINKVDFRVSKPATTAAKLATLNLEIGTTDLTGGVVALTSANCTPAGAAVAGSAVTAANVGTSTDSFSIEASSVTAFVEGNGWILVSIQNMDTADAFASIAAA